ncbi:MAG TPA: YceI family protein [Saprospiraceae bacterium]|nr:YceI family protein [Saprospiraceae bacterium]
MRPISLLFFLSYLLVSCTSKESAPDAASTTSSTDTRKLDSFRIQTAESLIYWMGSSPSGSHNGTISPAQGMLYAANRQLKAGRLDIDMHSIRNLDLDDEADRNDLENELKGGDFFAADSFPTAYYKITGVHWVNDSTYNAMIDGFLTIRDVMTPLKVKAHVVATDAMIEVVVPEFTIDRSAYNILHRSKKIIPELKNQWIDDEIRLSLRLVATKSN